MYSSLTDSSSMEGPLWFEARDALAGIADVAARYDTDGVDIYFLNSQMVGIGLKVSFACLSFLSSHLNSFTDRMELKSKDYLTGSRPRVSHLPEKSLRNFCWLTFLKLKTLRLPS